MADIALDADGLRRDRQRYSGLLAQAEQQIAAWNERADHLQQAIEGLDRLLALSDDDPARDGGVPRGPVLGRGVAPLQAPEAPAPTPAPPRPASEPPARRARPPKKKGSAPSAARPVPAPRSAPAPTATATPAAPDPVQPPASPAADAPKGTDALRIVFESDPQRSWSLADLIGALGARGWLPTSRRPEEGARISLKRLAERGAAVRTDDGRWRLAGDDGSTSEASPHAGPPNGPPPPAEVTGPGSTVAPEPERAPGPAPLPRPAGFGRPVGGTVTEL